MVFRLSLLGGAGIEGDEGPVCGVAAQRRGLAVLALLAAARHGRISRDKLIAYLCPGSSSEHAHNQLVDTVYALRKALGRDAVLSVGEDLRLNTTVVTTDLADFEAALRRDDLVNAVSVYQGPFLDGFSTSCSLEFEHWVDAERERLARNFARALETLAEECEATGDTHGAVEWWSRLARHDPYNACVVLRLMGALEASGDRAGALRCAYVHQKRLREDLDMEAGDDVIERVERVRAAHRAPEHHHLKPGVAAEQLP